MTRTPPVNRHTGTHEHRRAHIAPTGEVYVARVDGVTRGIEDDEIEVEIGQRIPGWKFGDFARKKDYT